MASARPAAPAAPAATPTPAPSGTHPSDYTKYLKWFVIFLAGLALLHGVGVYIQERSTREATAARTATRTQALPHDAPDLPWAWRLDRSKWPRLQVPPHGNSVPVPGIFGGHVVWGGSGFTVHCRYTDPEREGVVSEGTCQDGNIVESYARNDGDTLVYASYAYARAGEK